MAFKKIFRNLSNIFRKSHSQTVEIDELRDIVSEHSLKGQTTDEQLKRVVSILDAILGASLDGIYVKDRNGRHIYGNSATHYLMGLTEEETLGKNVLESLGEAKGGAVILQNDLQVLESGKTATFEEVFHFEDGDKIFQSMKSPYLDEQGNVIGLVGISRDITSERANQKSIELNERRLRAVLETLPVGVLMSDQSGKMIHVNREASNLWDESPKESISDYQNSYKVWWHESGQLLQADQWAMTRALKGEQVVNQIEEIENAQGKRKTLALFASPIVGADGENYGCVTVTQDFTQQKQTEKERESLYKQLESKTTLLQTVLDQLPTAVLVAEAPEGKLMLYSKKTPEVYRTEVASEEFLRKTIAFHSNGKPYDFSDWPLMRAISKGELVQNEDTAVLRADGTQAILRLSAAPVRSSSGEIVAGVVIADDVTEYKKTMEELKQAKEMSESANLLKSSFLANMSHEIRTPLGAILGFVDLMRDPLSSEDDKKHYLDIINRNCVQLKTIVNDILDFSKIEANYLMVEHIEFSLSGVLDEVRNSLLVHSNKKELQLLIEKDPEVPERVETDPTRLKQILMNVIGNAIKFTNHGSVRVFVRLQQNSTSHVTIGANDKLISILVQDTGIGISFEQAQRLFTVFTQADESMTRRYGGTGLGLALSRRIAKLLGGDIELKHSEIGVGSIFEITVRVHVPESQTQPSNALPVDRKDKFSPTDALKGLHILLVEDVPDIQALIERIIVKKGGSVTIANNGVEGVQKGLEVQPDLILMDIQMPLLDGYSATQQLREKGYNKPIIALTAHTLPDVRKKCLESGCTDYIAKPMRIDELVRKIEQVLKIKLNV